VTATLAEVAHDDPAALAPADAPTAPRRHTSRHRSLATHCLIYLVLLVASAPLLKLSGSYSSDEGAYAIQVHSLEAGHWDVAWPGSSVDPAGRWFPFVNVSKADGKFYAYVQHPVWPLAMRGAVALFGEAVGLRVLPIAGAVGVAAAAWLLAAEIDARRRRWAFWIAALGPVVANATMLWAHAPSAALAGFAALAVVRIDRRGWNTRRAVLLVGAVAAGVLLRAEGLVWALALAGGAGLTALAGRRRARIVTAAGIGAAVIAAAGTAVAFERWLIGVVSGGAYADPGVRHESGSYLLARLRGIEHEVVTAGLSAARPSMIGAIALVLAVVGGRKLASTRRSEGNGAASAVVLLGGAAAVFALRTVLDPAEPATGILGAWPIAAAGLVAALRRPIGHADRVLAAIVGLFAVGIVATQYDGGGGIEWGGRFFFPVIVPVAVIAAGGLHRAAVAVRPNARRALVAGAAALAVVPAVSGLVSVADTRQSGARFASDVERADVQVAVTTEVALPRMVWVTHPGVTWFLAGDDGQIADVLAALRTGCGGRVGLVVGRLPAGVPSGYRVVADRPTALGHRLVVVEPDPAHAPGFTSHRAGRLGGCPTGL
jgi:hypothetical protein